jgi:glycerol uptake facilitator-like aquaporin
VKRYLAECLGTAALLATVVGSGMMAVKLSGGNDGIALLANAGATAGMLYVLIQSLGPISGAHFNPLVSIALGWRERTPAKRVLGYLLAQLFGALLGVWLAHLMFDVSVLQTSSKIRTGQAQFISEVVASFGLLLTILLALEARATQIPALVASYVFAAYWFTASTAFANPAVTLARAFTDSFAGIRLIDVPAFVLAQFLGAACALLVSRFISQAPSRP